MVGRGTEDNFATMANIRLSGRAQAPPLQVWYCSTRVQSHVPMYSLFATHRSTSTTCLTLALWKWVAGELSRYNITPLFVLVAAGLTLSACCGQVDLRVPTSVPVVEPLEHEGSQGASVTTDNAIWQLVDARGPASAGQAFTVAASRVSPPGMERVAVTFAPEREGAADATVAILRRAPSAGNGNNPTCEHIVHLAARAGRVALGSSLGRCASPGSRNVIDLGVVLSRPHSGAPVDASAAAASSDTGLGKAFPLAFINEGSMDIHVLSVDSSSDTVQVSPLQAPADGTPAARCLHVVARPTL